MSAILPDGLRHHQVEVNGVELHYVSAGEGPLMLFLHGFPQCWYEFRHQLTEFSRDHLVVAPDLRGYNLSGKPQHLQEAGVVPAVEDLRQLVAQLGRDRFTLVGHDWGAAISWSFAIQYPQLLDRVVILCTPHPALFERELRENPEQQQACQYMLVVRAPEGEQVLTADEFAAMRLQFEQAEFIDDDDLAVYKQAWSQPGAPSGMLSYYRREGLGPPSEHAVARGDYARHLHSQVVEVPTLVIYPDADIFTRPGCHRGLERYVPELTFRTIEGGSHWVAEEHPDLVNRWIREFLAQQRRDRAVAA